MKPIVGISTSYDNDEKAHLLRDHYILAILKAGGVPIMLPAVAENDIIQSYTKICDALVLSGGGDAHPSYWGELPDKELGEVSPLRDIFEIELVRNIMKIRKPVLGICRGCQIINIAAGGSIIQNIEGKFMHQQKAPRDYASHQVFVQNHSKLAAILKTEEIEVNSFHHQAVKIPGPSMRISACASDGTIEAIEFSGRHQFAVGIQWHPECMEDVYADYLFEALIEATDMRDRSSPG